MSQVMFILIQMALVFLLGVARTASGFSGALYMVSAGFAFSAIISLPVTTHSRDFEPAQTFYLCNY